MTQDTEEPGSTNTWSPSPHVETGGSGCESRDDVSGCT
jgi:hypothetical protein